MNAVLDASGIGVVLGQRQVLQDVDLSLAAGELVGLLGPNGAGKTTMLRALLGLLPLAAGRVLIDGLPPHRSRPLVGYVPQRHEFAWDFPISVAGAVMTGRTRSIGPLRRPGATDRAAVDAAVRRVGLADLCDRAIGELSGGQRQRVLVARALARRPRLLLLDEPLTGVDSPTTDLLTELFGELTDDGVAVLMTTHDLVAAASMCDRLCLVNRRVIAQGPPGALTDPDVWLRAFGGSSAHALQAALRAGGRPDMEVGA